MSNYRDKALNVFGKVCVNCGSSKEIEVHHVDGNKENNALENLLPLCSECHETVHNGWPPRKSLTRELKRTVGVKLPEPVFVEVHSQAELKDAEGVPNEELRELVEEWKTDAKHLEEKFAAGLLRYKAYELEELIND